LARQLCELVQLKQLQKVLDCESDLKQVRLALRLMGVLKIDKKLQDQLFAEIQDNNNLLATWQDSFVNLSN
jgi:hypothetical protein